ncbi:MAG: cupin domain-containing protein [bacterium]
MKRKQKKAKIKIIKKPWGQEIWFADSPKYLGKILIVNKGCRLSAQYHAKKHETMYCESGSCEFELNGKKKVFRKGHAIVIPPGTIHRIYAKYGGVRIFEVSTPHPDDVIRLRDDYGRIK